MAACCFARVLTIASTIILQRNGPALYRDIVRLRTLQQSESANSLRFPTHCARRLVRRCTRLGVRGHSLGVVKSLRSLGLPD